MLNRKGNFVSIHWILALSFFFILILGCTGLAGERELPEGWEADLYYATALAERADRPAIREVFYFHEDALLHYRSIAYDKRLKANIGLITEEGDRFPELQESVDTATNGRVARGDSDGTQEFHFVPISPEVKSVILEQFSTVDMSLGEDGASDVMDTVSYSVPGLRKNEFFFEQDVTASLFNSLECLFPEEKIRIYLVEDESIRKACYDLFQPLGTQGNEEELAKELDEVRELVNWEEYRKDRTYAMPAEQKNSEGTAMEGMTEE